MSKLTVTKRAHALSAIFLEFETLGFTGASAGNGNRTFEIPFGAFDLEDQAEPGYFVWLAVGFFSPFRNPEGLASSKMV